MSKSSKQAGSKTTKAASKQRAAGRGRKAAGKAAPAGGDSMEQKVANAAGAALARAAADNPLVAAEASRFTELLGKATAEQLKEALSAEGLSAKKRSRIEAALKYRTAPPKAEPAERACPKCGSADLTFNKRGFTCAKCGHRQDADDVAKTVEAVQTGDLTKGVEVPTAGKKKPLAKAVRPKGKMSGLDAAAKVLAESAEPLNAKQIVEQAAAKGYWSSTAATPHATIYSAIITEIAKKGADSRFKKTDRGLFAATGAARKA
ncbi:MAG: hypothetical protein BIFFINMI_00960 [Phycisphaerae bacterium]|nr:hypothetical protein [Phycisphaerae bacterium]